MNNKPGNNKKLDNTKKRLFQGYIDSIPAINKVTNYNEKVLNSLEDKKARAFYYYYDKNFQTENNTIQ